MTTALKHGQARRLSKAVDSISRIAHAPRFHYSVVVDVALPDRGYGLEKEMYSDVQFREGDELFLCDGLEDVKIRSICWYFHTPNHAFMALEDLELEEGDWSELFDNFDSSSSPRPESWDRTRLKYT